MAWGLLPSLGPPASLCPVRVCVSVGPQAGLPKPSSAPTGPRSSPGLSLAPGGGHYPWPLLRRPRQAARALAGHSPAVQGQPRCLPPQLHHHHHQGQRRPRDGEGRGRGGRRGGKQRAAGGEKEREEQSEHGIIHDHTLGAAESHATSSLMGEEGRSVPRNPGEGAPWADGRRTALGKKGRAPGGRLTSPQRFSASLLPRTPQHLGALPWPTLWPDKPPSQPALDFLVLQPSMAPKSWGSPTYLPATALTLCVPSQPCPTAPCPVAGVTGCKHWPSSFQA